MMALPLAVSILRKKRDEIRDTIAAYEARLAQAQADLGSVIAALRLFEVTDTNEDMPRYADISRVFKRGDILVLCLAILKEESPLDTRQITERIMKAKGFDARDTVFAQALAHRVVDTLRYRALRWGDIDHSQKRRGVCLWALL